jgi:hypothetical protein
MKRFLLVLLSFLISVLILALCVSYGIKSVVVNIISDNIIKGEITSNVIEEIKDTYSNVSYDLLEEIEINTKNSDEVNKITQKYLGGILDSLSGKDEIEVPNTKEELLTIIEDNEKILKENGIDFTDEQKDHITSELVESGVIDEVYKKLFDELKDNMSDNEEKLVSTYVFIQSNTFRMICFSSIFILLLIIALLKRSFYRWSVNLGISFVISGLLIIFLLPIMVNELGDIFASKLIGQNLSTNINNIVNYGYVCVMLSALFIVIYIIGNKVTRYNERKNDY